MKQLLASGLCGNSVNPFVQSRTFKAHSAFILWTALSHNMAQYCHSYTLKESFFPIW